MTRLRMESSDRSRLVAFRRYPALVFIAAAAALAILLPTALTLPNQAFREGCPSCAEPTYVGAGATDGRIIPLYDSLNLLFWGIQAAGPRLAPSSLDKGLHAIREHRSPNPFVPAAYFTSGNYSWVKDAMEIWWDGAGTEPGTNKPGCYRLANEGRRFRAGEWEEGDADLRVGGAPCQGPAR